MKKISGLSIVAFGILSVFLFAFCAKENTEDNMSVKNWNLESKTIAGVNAGIDCDQNAKWIFKSDGSYVISDNCDNTESGTWKLAEEGKILTLDEVTSYNVIESSVGKLVIEMEVGEIGLIRWSFD
ncbi:lipocalin family protein [Williamwhitmania taraxaci]|uniref:Lipocalin-like domain-containing protein n=1 Tax=Williamwhitmania taraxaci TaxID=1640674 RepID=A0A1G6PV00_9BACT|nr:lipocalin family protein [Williamwhitmania taraxaci]SDC83791.1 Lipocalin-like domain-containing protein [Williamwhitmania taraxaci]